MNNNFGIKIKSYKSSYLLQAELGMIEKAYYTKAQLPKSLLLNHLIENGLNVVNGSTRDVIYVEFNGGIKDEDGNQLYTKGEVREKLYKDGITITYDDSRGETKVHYNFIYRGAGQAKAGKVAMICDRLYEDTKEWMCDWVESDDIVSTAAYQSLVASGIEDTIEINPNNILILEDAVAEGSHNVTSIELDDGKCIARKINDYMVKAECFDGQGLIDLKLTKDYDGFVLLRQHYTKSCAFRTDIQRFFKDYFGDEYKNAKVTDCFGREMRAKDVKLIMCKSSVKWTKYGVSFDQWADKVREDGCLFGIVKSAHESKHYPLVQSSYQHTNALDMSGMAEVMAQSIDYAYNLKSDDLFFMGYLYDNADYSNDYRCLYECVRRNGDFIDSEYFRDRRSTIIKNLVRKMKGGKLLHHGTYATVVGSPYAMLLHSVGEDIHKDDTFSIEDDAVQCRCGFFEDDEHLAGFRNPFNSRSNLSYLHNVNNEKLDRYFRLGNFVIAVNTIGTDIMDRNNGMDMDSDTLMLTDQYKIVEHAKMCYSEYPTIVNNIPMSKVHYDDTPEDRARVDEKIQSSQAGIGLSANLSQLAQTYWYTFGGDDKYEAIDMLSTLCQCIIDSSKRLYEVDTDGELRRFKKMLGVTECGYPEWFKSAKELTDDKINDDLMSPMSICYDLKVPNYRHQAKQHEMTKYVGWGSVSNKGKLKDIEKLIDEYSDAFDSCKANDDDEAILIERDDLMRKMRKIRLDEEMIDVLLARVFDKYRSKNRHKKNVATLVSVLFELEPSKTVRCLTTEIEHIY